MDAVGDIAATIGTAADVSGDRCCKGKALLLFKIATVVIAAIDLASDWYNYVDFSKSNFDEYFAKLMLLFAQISTALFVLDIFLLVIKLRKPESCVALQLLLGKMSTFMLWFVEDMCTLGLVIAIYLKGHCPLLLQYRTTVGRVAIVASGISVMWRQISVFIVNNKGLESWLRGKNCLIQKCLFSIWHPCNNVSFLISLAIALVCFGIALWPVPNFNNTAIIISQQIDARFYVDGKCSYRKDWANNIKTTWKNVTCFGLTNRVSLGIFFELRESDELLKYAPCHVASPFSKQFLQAEHAQQLNESISCTIIFRMKYNQEKSELLYNTGYQMVLPNHSCVGAPLKEQSVMVPATDVWQDQAIVGAIWRGVCGTEYCSSSWLRGTNSTRESRGQRPRFLRPQTGCDGNNASLPSPPWNIPAQLEVNVRNLTLQLDTCHVTPRFEPSLGFNISCGAGNYTEHDNGNAIITLDDVEYSYCDRIDEEDT